ncbi:MAG: hypothetical protein KatS3mg036_0123 [Ignavibacterium sp.]|nr:MAG: hypothetical protein KatS3mg036_0123 [Ignavibacterium sp.]
MRRKVFNLLPIIVIFYYHLLFGQIKFAWITDTHIGSPGC